MKDYTGCHPGLEFVQMYQKLEPHRLEQSNALNRENKDLIEKTQKVQSLLALINSKQQHSKDKVEFNSQEDRDLVDQVRGFDSHLFPTVPYEISGKEAVQGLKDNLNNYLSTLQPQMTRTGMEFQQGLNEGLEFFHAGNRIVQDEKDGKTRIISKSHSQKG